MERRAGAGVAQVPGLVSERIQVEIDMRRKDAKCYGNMFFVLQPLDKPYPNYGPSYLNPNTGGSTITTNAAQMA